MMLAYNLVRVDPISFFGSFVFKYLATEIFTMMLSEAQYIFLDSLASLQIDPSEKLDPEVEDILVDLAEDFLESVSS